MISTVALGTAKANYERWGLKDIRIEVGEHKKLVDTLLKFGRNWSVSLEGSSILIKPML